MFMQVVSSQNVENKKSTSFLMQTVDKISHSFAFDELISYANTYNREKQNETIKNVYPAPFNFKNKVLNFV